MAREEFCAVSDRTRYPDDGKLVSEVDEAGASCLGGCREVDDAWKDQLAKMRALLSNRPRGRESFSFWATL